MTITASQTRGVVATSSVCMHTAEDGFNQRGDGTVFTSAVTSHTLWFHRPFRTDRWLLLRQHSPVLAHGRRFGRGDVLSEDGSLVACYAQEALLRFSR